MSISKRDHSQMDSKGFPIRDENSNDSEGNHSPVKLSKTSAQWTQSTEGDVDSNFNCETDELSFEYASDDFIDYSDYSSVSSTPESYCFSPTFESDLLTPQFTVLTCEQIVDLMEELITYTSDRIDLPPATIKMLLIQYTWCPQKLMDKYFTYGNNEEFLEVEHQIVYAEESSATGEESSATGEESSTTFECIICCEIADETFSLLCGHDFCHNCWTSYLTEKMDSYECGPIIRCPASRCHNFVNDENISKFITDNNLILKYNEKVFKNFVSVNNCLVQCPSPLCELVIQLDDSSQTIPDVTCDCHRQFCCSCSKEWHFPVPCKYMSKWTLDDDNATNIYVNVFTKGCPNCSALIEKNGGCNHMRCRNCNYEFCWVCFGEWGFHAENYLCNKYELDVSVGAPSRKISRLNHFWYRYVNHKRSMLIEETYFVPANFRIFSEMYQDAINVLRECRRTLMLSYVFVYYLVEDSEVHIFEDNQADLEKSTEALSLYLENELTKQKKMKNEIEVQIRNQVGNQTDIITRIRDKKTYCENRRKVLLNHIIEGYEKDTWIFEP